jgi:hypothetical protein
MTGYVINTDNPFWEIGCRFSWMCRNDSFSAIAKKIPGLSSATVGRYIKGDLFPASPEFYAYVNERGFSINYILFGDGEPVTRRPVDLIDPDLEEKALIERLALIEPRLLARGLQLDSLGSQPVFAKRTGSRTRLLSLGG